MKKNLLVTLGLLIVFSTSMAQEIRIGLSFDQLYSKEFDRLIQTYNFTRPFLDNHQPLISNGVQARISYLFNPQKNLSSGIALGHSYHWSSAKNNAADVRFHFNTYKLGYLLHLENDHFINGFFVDFIFSGNVGLLTKKINQEAFKVDGEILRSWQFGGHAQLNVGFKISLSHEASISPFAGIGIAPYMTEGQSEIVINQTSTLVDQEYDAMMNWNVGLLVQFSQEPRKRKKR